jgi:transcriptional regulator with XRE-family HTH domain
MSTVNPIREVSILYAHVCTERAACPVTKMCTVSLLLLVVSLNISQQYVTIKETVVQVEKFQLGVFLKRARESQNLSTRDLERRVRESERESSVTASQINKIENDKTNPSLQTLQKIAAALDLPLVIILDGSDMNPDTVTIVSSPEVAQELPQALQRTELIQLLLLCQKLNEEQVSAILGVARSIRGFTQPMHETQTLSEESSS